MKLSEFSESSDYLGVEKLENGCQLINMVALDNHVVVADTAFQEIVERLAEAQTYLRTLQRTVDESTERKFVQNLDS